MITMIAARGANGVIGINNALPWRLVGELKFFKRMTEGQTILMGRKTFESIGKRPLPDRTNVVLSTTMELRDDVWVIDDVAKITLVDFTVIGGEQLYRYFLPIADRLILTEVELDEDDGLVGDALFPSFSLDEWNIVSSEPAVYYDQIRQKNVMCSHVIYKRTR